MVCLIGTSPASWLRVQHFFETNYKRGHGLFRQNMPFPVTSDILKNYRGEFG